MIRRVYILLAALCLSGSLAAGADPIITTQIIEPSIAFNTMQVVQDASGAEHIFTVGGSLVHFYRTGENWQVEEIDYQNPIGSAILAAVPFLDHIVVFYYHDNGELGLAEGNTGAWELAAAPSAANDSDVVSACAAGGHTLWLFAHSLATRSLRAYRRDDGVWDDAPMIIDDDGDCGVWMSAVSRGGTTFQLVYQAGNPYYDLRYASYDGADLTKSTILADGEQGEFLSLAVDATGFLHLSAWDGLQNDLLYGHCSTYGEWTFSTADSAPGAGRGTAIMVDQFHRPAIAYFDENQNLAMSRWNGSNWEKETVGGPLPNPVKLGLSINLSQPAVSIMNILDAGAPHPVKVLACYRKEGDQWSRSEIAHISWYTGLDLMRDAAGHAVILAINEAMFSLWRNIAGVYDWTNYYPNDPRQDQYLAHGAIDSNDRIHIIGASYTNAATDDHYKLEYWRIVGDQATRETILETDVKDLQLAVDSAGYPHLLFTVPSAADDNELLLYSADRNDDGWHIELLTDSAPSSFDARMLLDKDDHMHIVFSVASGDYAYDIYYGIKIAGVWNISYLTTSNEITGRNVAPHIALAVDDAAIPSVACDQSYRIHYFELCGERWHESTIENSGSILSFQIVFDHHDRPAILSYGTLGDPYTEMVLLWQNGLSWREDWLNLSFGVYSHAIVYDLVSSPDEVLTGACAGFNYPLTLFDIRFPPPSVNFRLSGKNFTAGDQFKVEYEVANGEQPASYALAVLLEIPLGDVSLFYSWPDWQPLDHGVALTPLELTANETRAGTILDIDWPEGAGSLSGLAFWAALLDASAQEPQADLAHVYFSYD